jgi:hypothetical protein
MATFDQATAVHGGNGAYTVELDPLWTVSDKPHGGYLLAALARAALAEDRTDDQDAAHPHPLSASAVYLAAPRVGPAAITVEVLRRGRSASQVRARLIQQDRPHVEALFTLGRLEPTDEGWTAAGPVEVAPLSQCPRSPVRPPGAGVSVNMLELVDQRLDVTSFGDRERSEAEPLRGGSGEIRGWLSFADGRPFDPVSLLYAADGFPPATFTLGSVGWVPTMELTVYVRGIPAPGPLRVRQRARVLQGSLVDQVCEIWDTEDRVVVQATQLAGVRMAANRP